MPSFSTTRRVAHTPTNMFDLVADAEKYPLFLPLCEALRIRGRQDMGEGRTLLVADMTVGYKAIRETFTSRVVLDRPALTIRVAYLDGPFQHLDNVWMFREVGERSCEIGFSIDYAFKNRVLGALMGTMFDKAFRKFSEAFEKRADEVYGKM